MSNTQYTYDEDTYSDLYKDVFGCRPGQSAMEQWDKFTPDEKQAEWDLICGMLRTQCEEEAEDQDAAIAAFEDWVDDEIEAACVSRETAIKNVIARRCDADDAVDPMFVCYKFNLPFGYFSRPTVTSQ